VAAEGISTETRKFEVAYIFREHGEAYRDKHPRSQIPPAKLEA